MILVLHGPNLNLLGKRQPEIYGTMTFQELNEGIRTYCAERCIEIIIEQSNSEGTLIDILQGFDGDGIVFNAGAYTHYSYAIYDALLAIGVPAVEVHLTDITQRDVFRQKSVIAPACVAHFAGGGIQSYLDGIAFLVLRQQKE